MKPRVPEAGRSKTELRRGHVVEQRSAEVATTEAEQEFLFATEVGGAVGETSPPLTGVPVADDQRSRDEMPRPL